VQLSREELAWAAGFVDGEGHFGFHPTNVKKISGTAVLDANQIDRRVLDRLRRYLGMGHINGPYKYRKNDSPIYTFRIYGFEHVQAAVAMLWPWLGEVKKLQAKTALQNAREFHTRPKLKTGPSPREAICHPGRKHIAKGLCGSCYQISWRKNVK
jgi:hypothetical protein